ncbi:MAG: hypothetical protein AVDCRST_MAG86-1923 [uncultured Truepera sp.]|uniref:Molecular chaperone Tir n=1 Tax=uncultured Truepera sp. TaxID=543023 RepID=A0A6J4V9F6_9DEIN|nr:MAG: hypothetical protein AVDCRST_MAG86-1923 [uncultured Truepera sp.]
MPDFESVKRYLTNLELPIIEEDAAAEIVVVSDEDSGVSRLVIDCEAPLLILEQRIMDAPAAPGELYKRLLQMNRTLVHGAFVLDEAGQAVIFRDTLQLATLDELELESSIDALSLALAEYGSELLSYARPSADK